MIDQPTLSYTETAEIVIEEAGIDEPINAFELGYFLYYFRAAYVACLISLEFKEIPLGEAIARANADLLAPLTGEVATLWLTDLPKNFDLEFIAISKQSPLRLVSTTTRVCLIALTMAVILSGGEASIASAQFKLPPIAHGIRELKQAFGKEQTRPLPSERQSSSQESGTLYE